MKRYDVVVVGGGVLGVCVSYYVAFLNPGSAIALVEREGGVARHASGRNTGKVHAPYLYDPDKKGLFARAAMAGYGMWRRYAAEKGHPFVEDGVAEVALDADQAKMLDVYMRWGMRNGLGESDMEMVNGRRFREDEAEVRCHAALVCRRDASVDYRAMVESLMDDARGAGVAFLPDHNATSFAVSDGGVDVALGGIGAVHAKFLVNAAGGQAVDVAHSMGVAERYADIHFRGDYWRAPDEYRGLTRTSIYSVPRHPEYPFLDPHWIVRADGACEVGPGAVPVFSPYGYGLAENARRFVPKTLEMLRSGARHVLRDPRFRGMTAAEAWSSVSKRAMISRVKRFIPRLDPARFARRGTAGIRSVVVDDSGRFVPDAMVLEGPHSVHVLNYNSPGATGALPFAAHLVDHIHSRGLFRNSLDDARCGFWTFADVVGMME